MRSAVARADALARARHPAGRDRLAGDGSAGARRHERHRRRGRRRDRAVDRPPHRRARAPPRREGERLQDLAAAAGRQALEQAGLPAADWTWCWSRRSAPTSSAQRRAAGGAGPGARPRRGDGRRRRLHRLPVGPLAGRRPGGGGRCEHVLVIGADVLSRFTDKSDRGTAALFADGPARCWSAPRTAARASSATSPCTPTAPAARRSAPPTTTGSSTWRATTPSRRLSSACPSRRSRRSIGSASSRRHRPVRPPPGQRPHPRRRLRPARPHANA